MISQIPSTVPGTPWFRGRFYKLWVWIPAGKEVRNLHIVLCLNTATLYGSDVYMQLGNTGEGCVVGFIKIFCWCRGLKCHLKIVRDCFSMLWLLGNFRMYYTVHVLLNVALESREVFYSVFQVCKDLPVLLLC
jgi:hypothetical protein